MDKLEKEENEEEDESKAKMVVTIVEEEEKEKKGKKKEEEKKKRKKKWSRGKIISNCDIYQQTSTDIQNSWVIISTKPINLGLDNY